MTNEINAQHVKALELHNRIMVSAQLVQTNLWDMCNGLKEMRDGKLYKELGYQNFEEYCESECGMKRTNAHKYISIIENIDPENVSSMKHFGMTKLYLLSTLSEADQQKITTENDVESMTVKELEKEIRYLKDKNHEMDAQLDEQTQLLTEARRKAADAKRDREEAEEEVSRLQRKIGELESRPIDVAVAEPSEDIRQLKLTIRNLERTTDEQIDRLQTEHEKDIRDLREKNRRDTERQLAEQKAAYEKKLAEAEHSGDSADDKQVFKAYYSVAYDAFSRMIEFAEKSEEKDFFRAKIASLISAFTNMNGR